VWVFPKPEIWRCPHQLGPSTPGCEQTEKPEGKEKAVAERVKPRTTNTNRWFIKFELS
jgi:hypothetical protein